jgi:hypothetical protein
MHVLLALRTRFGSGLDPALGVPRNSKKWCSPRRRQCVATWPRFMSCGAYVGTVFDVATLAHGPGLQYGASHLQVGALYCTNSFPLNDILPKLPKYAVRMSRVAIRTLQCHEDTLQNGRQQMRTPSNHELHATAAVHSSDKVSVRKLKS